MKETVTYAGREIPILGYWDTVIVGGGSAGVSAGITSAQGGNTTLLIDKNIRLGGTATNALVTPMMKSYTGHHANFCALEKKLQELGDETRDSIQAGNLWFTTELMTQALEELYTQAGGEILFDAVLVDCLLREKRLEYLIVVTVEGLGAVKGAHFVDASGDAALLRTAGVPYGHGDHIGHNQLSSLRFEMGGIDLVKFRNYLHSLNDVRSCYGEDYFYEASMVNGDGWALEPLFHKGLANGVLHEEDLHYFQGFVVPGKPGCLSFNCPHLVKLKDNTSAFARSTNILAGRQMMYRLVAFLTGYVPGFEHAYLMQTASMLGIRESYRLIGCYILEEEDYSKMARFPDGVARGDWLIDIHSANDGLYHRDIYQKGDYYEIPYRSMICNEVENLVVAGRCISATFRMQASVRIIPTCIDMGEAAGAACVYAQKNGIALNAIDGARLREQLPYYPV